MSTQISKLLPLFAKFLLVYVCIYLWIIYSYSPTNTQPNNNESNDKQIYNKLKQIGLKFHQTLSTADNQIFYTLIENKDRYDAYYRAKWGTRQLGYATYSLDFDLITDYGSQDIIGKDPRSFACYNKQFITDNQFDDGQILDISDRNNIKYHKIKLKGKNFSYFCYNNALYVMERIDPLRIYAIDNDMNLMEYYINTDTYNSLLIARYGSLMNNMILISDDNSWRGGTSGFQTHVTSDFIIGFGHRTLFYGEMVTHRPYLWLLNMKRKKIYIRSLDEQKDYDSENKIIDPTTILCRNNTYYLVTAESQTHWRKEQNYKNNVYEIRNMNELINIL